MSDQSHSPVSSDSLPENLAKIEDLILGSGADDFERIKSYSDVFCPFEAIGMVHQEIRHSNFLAYCLNPHKPHGFGDELLREFLYLVADEVETLPSKLELSLMSLHNAEIRREWNHIDLLIRVPNEDGQEIVVAIEQKIHAAEGLNQLKRYTEVVKDHFEKTKHTALIFLPKDATAPSESETWGQLSLQDVVRRFEIVANTRLITAKGTPLLNQYIAMLRRHIMPDNTLTEIAQKLWNEHGEALNLLMEHRPDQHSEIVAAFKAARTEMAETLNAKLKGKGFEGTDITLEPVFDNNWVGHFSVTSWAAIPELSKKVEDKNVSILMPEIAGDRNALRYWSSMVLHPGDAEQRKAIYKTISETAAGKGTGKISIGRRNPIDKIPQYKHFSRIEIAAAPKESDFKETDEFLHDIKSNFVKHWEKALPLYDKLLRSKLLVQ
ncbi:PD-(D/E)XK nuclease family protein [Shimia sp. CNT1-13L.2]|uniref:PDDEXK-like family protein n=1 Tax=Shimia sp. CNT1-13L.2 TaxID=2959663 RepID=UPI0020CD426C|nr:PD-(D/E)XK nuclease family protein [Shimia sp. CNT1-13L.2]MCP9482679.1 PD-(D/E)XK nuclease family protein [Shimia sp. CNT1-13L.2]